MPELVLFAAAFAAGVVNAIAGGGTLITFPTLLAVGRDPILANATNTVSLWPGSIAAMAGLRGEFGGLRNWAVRLAVPSAVGGLAGALLLLATPSALFAWLVPWLILFATALFAASGAIGTAVRGHLGAHEVPRPRSWAGPMLFQLGVAVYGGYFGAGIGIMMLAGLAVMGFGRIHKMIALRNFYATLINGVAAMWFAFQGAVVWRDAVVLAAGQVVGSYAGARVATRLPQVVVRWAVVGIGITITAVLFGRG